MSYIRTKLNNSIKASKIDIDNENINLIKSKMIAQLSEKNLLKYDVSNYEKHEITIYHMDSLYRDNTNDIYELKKQYL